MNKEIEKIQEIYSDVLDCVYGTKNRTELLLRLESSIKGIEKSNTALLNKLEEEVEKYFTKKYGKRCKTKDIDDFPEIKDDKDSNRCFVCEIWETVDDIKSIIAKLKRGGE